MKYLRFFESIGIIGTSNQFREVDLQLLWDDLNYYQFKLFDKQKHIDFYFHKLLEQLLLNKEIEFIRSIHPYDKEVSFGESGRVKEIDIVDNPIEKTKKIIGNLYEVRYSRHGIYQTEDTEAWILAKIDSSVNYPDKKVKKPIIIKIYDSDLSDIEKQIDLLKMTEKYNI